MKYTCVLEFAGSGEYMAAVNNARTEKAFAELAEILPDLVEILFEKDPEPPPPSPPGGWPKIYSYSLNSNGVLASYSVETTADPTIYSYTVTSGANKFSRKAFQKAGNILASLVGLAVGHGLTYCSFKQEA